MAGNWRGERSPARRGGVERPSRPRRSSGREGPRRLDARRSTSRLPRGQPRTRAPRPIGSRAFLCAYGSLNPLGLDSIPPPPTSLRADDGPSGPWSSLPRFLPIKLGSTGRPAIWSDSGKKAKSGVVLDSGYSGQVAQSSFPRSSVGMPSWTLPRPLPFDTADGPRRRRSVEDGIPTRSVGTSVSTGRPAIWSDSGKKAKSTGPGHGAVHPDPIPMIWYFAGNTLGLLLLCLVPIDKIGQNL